VWTGGWAPRRYQAARWQVETDERSEAPFVEEVDGPLVTLLEVSEG